MESTSIGALVKCGRINRRYWAAMVLAILPVEGRRGQDGQQTSRDREITAEVAGKREGSCLEILRVCRVTFF